MRMEVAGYREVLIAEIPPRCACLEAKLAALAIADAAIVTSVSSEAATAALRQLFGACPGSETVTHTRDGCLPPLKCRHPKGKDYLRQAASALNPNDAHS